MSWSGIGKPWFVEEGCGENLGGGEDVFVDVFSEVFVEMEREEGIFQR